MALDHAGFNGHGRTAYFDRTEYVALDSLQVQFVVDEAWPLRSTAGADDLRSAHIDLANNHAPSGLEYRSGTSMYRECR